MYLFCGRWLGVCGVGLCPFGCVVVVELVGRVGLVGFVVMVWLGWTLLVGWLVAVMG